MIRNGRTIKMIDRDLFYWLAPLIFFATKTTKGIYRKTKNSQFLFILLLLGAFLICVFWFVFDSYRDAFTGLVPTESNEDANRGDWGAFGDYFGGLLNPVVALVGIILVAYGIYQTRKEVDELKKSFNIQNFDSRFFKMLTLLEKSRDDLIYQHYPSENETQKRLRAHLDLPHQVSLLQKTNGADVFKVLDVSVFSISRRSDNSPILQDSFLVKELLDLKDTTLNNAIDVSYQRNLSKSFITMCTILNKHDVQNSWL